MLRLKRRGDVSAKQRKEIAKWFNRKKQGLKDYFRKNLKGESEYYKKVERLYNLPQDAPDWLVNKVEDDPHYLQTEELYKVKTPLKSDQVLMDKLDHIIDYLVWYTSENPSKSLINVTWHHVKDGMEEWEKSFEVEETEGLLPGEKTVLNTKSGYSWVELTDKESLDNEGSRMSHCVGGYCNLVLSGDRIIYSLRDKSNKPHITLEYSTTEKVIQQAKGTGNSPVSFKYDQDLIELLEFIQNSKGKLFELGSDIEAVGIFLHNDKLYSVKDGVSISGDMVKPENITSDTIKVFVGNTPGLAYYVEDKDTLHSVMDNNPRAVALVHKVPDEMILELLEDYNYSYPVLNSKYKNSKAIVEKAFEVILSAPDDYEILQTFLHFPAKFRNDPKVWGLLTDKDYFDDMLMSISGDSIAENFSLLENHLDAMHGSTFREDPFLGLSQNLKKGHVDTLMKNKVFRNYFDPRVYTTAFGNSEIAEALMLRDETVDFLKEDIDHSSAEFGEELVRTFGKIRIVSDEVIDEYEKELYPYLWDKLLEDLDQIYRIPDAKYLPRDSIITSSLVYMKRSDYREKLADKLISKMEKGEGPGYLRFNEIIRHYFFKDTDLPRIRETIRAHGDFTEVNDGFSRSSLENVIDEDTAKALVSSVPEADFLLEYDGSKIIHQILAVSPEVRDRMTNYVINGNIELEQALGNKFGDRVDLRFEFYKKLFLARPKAVLGRRIDGLVMMYKDPDVLDKFVEVILKESPEDFFGFAHSFSNLDDLLDNVEVFARLEKILIGDLGNVDLGITITMSSLVDAMIRKSTRLQDFLINHLELGTLPGYIMTHRDLARLLRGVPYIVDRARPIFIDNPSLMGNFRELSDDSYGTILMESVKKDVNNVFKAEDTGGILYLNPLRADKNVMKEVYDLAKRSDSLKTFMKFYALFGDFAESYGFVESVVSVALRDDGTQKLGEEEANNLFRTLDQDPVILERIKEETDIIKFFNKLHPHKVTPGYYRMYLETVSKELKDRAYKGGKVSILDILPEYRSDRKMTRLLDLLSKKYPGQVEMENERELSILGRIARFSNVR
jgi:hypothetical protein